MRAQTTVIIDATVPEEGGATVLRVVWVQKKLCCSESLLKIGMHSRYLQVLAFSTCENDFYYLIGCNRLLVHTSTLSSQKGIEIKSSAPLQINRRCRDSAIMEEKKKRHGNNLPVFTANMKMQIALGWNCVYTMLLSDLLYVVSESRYCCYRSKADGNPLP